MATHDDNWLDAFPVLRDIADPAWLKAVNTARLIGVGAGVTLFGENEPCGDFLLIMEGSVRVQRLAANGQIITLYHLQPGQSCELTTTCLLGGKRYPAEGVAETPVRAVLIPEMPFREALAQSPQLGQFVFSTLDKAVNELIVLVEEVAFGHIDRRLAHCLVHKAQSRDYVDATHQELAEELGTAREVVSRVLKEFERQGWVRLRRGRIELYRLHELQALAGSVV